MNPAHAAAARSIRNAVANKAIGGFVRAFFSALASYNK